MGTSIFLPQSLLFFFLKKVYFFVFSFFVFFSAVCVVGPPWPQCLILRTLSQTAMSQRRRNNTRRRNDRNVGGFAKKVSGYFCYFFLVVRRLIVVERHLFWDISRFFCAYNCFSNSPIYFVSEIWFVHMFSCIFLLIQIIEIMYSQPRKEHTLLLYQYTSNPNTKSFRAFGSVDEAVQGIFSSLIIF